MAPLHIGSSANLAVAGLALGVVYVVASCFYNIFLHPLRKVPGPLLYRVSVIPRSIDFMTGRLPMKLVDMHKQYGSAVRIRPNEVVFSSPQAWRDIYGHRKAGEPEFAKDENFYRLFKHTPVSILNAGREDHALLRRQLSHAFSDKIMREQEPIIDGYVKLLVHRIRERLEQSPNTPLDMTRWYNWTTFDVIGDLSFGISGGFGCLENASYHPWIRIITDSIRQNALFGGFADLGFRKVIQTIARTNITKNQQNRAIVHEKVQERMAIGSERPDFISSLLSKKGGLDLDLGGLVSNATLLVIAGSETTATLLSGATFLLTTHPKVLKKLADEVRSSFSSEDEITLTNVGHLSYMLAVLNESLRCYPPVVYGMPRRVPRGGGVIDGHAISENTVVSVFQYAAHHDEKYWTEPDEFRPERWLGDEKYRNDLLDAMQPFSTGPRNCIGRNLAYSEMRLILAKIIFNFDMRLDDGAREWLSTQKAYVIWDKPPLPVYLKPVVR
ncbi:putative cytochrome P450 monooxygenase [Xylariaceae sp. FL0255]|nr:putative cytochrome P450 monooxygenase [Xylariaceae sp. FL0255]